MRDKFVWCRNTIKSMKAELYDDIHECYNTLREEIFAGINFRELGFTEDLAGINIRELSLSKDFAGINFRESALYKDFAGVNFKFCFK